jgi:hypothetical protein
MTDDTLHIRVRAEYNEMPGLRLTLAQAARLFNIEKTSCEEVLERLVCAGALWTNGREFLARDSGRRFA